MKKEKKEQKIKVIPNWTIIIIVVSIVFGIMPMLLVGGFFAYEMFSENDQLEVKGIYTFVDDNLRINNTTVIGIYNEEYNAYYVTGEITNISDSTYSADITYNLLDTKGNVLGKAVGYIENIKSGQTWKFKAVYYEIDAKETSSYNLDEVTTY